MINDQNIRCPVCGSYQFKQTFQLSVGKNKDGTCKWTTRKYREFNKLECDKVQVLCVPPIDDTWFRCSMCNNEFNDNMQLYCELKWPGLYSKE
jgi:DNA-directed RNA polymerase subunit RPC12/RpoP